MSKRTDFEKFALSNNVSGTTLDKYKKQVNNFNKPNMSWQSPSIVIEGNNPLISTDIFSRMMADRIIFIGSEIDEYSASIVLSQLLYLNSQDSEADISMYINSPGGSVYDGLAIYDTMQYISPDIQTICTGMAASMASIILCAGTKGKRYALPHSRVLIHQPMSGIAPGTQASDIEIECKEILKLKDELYKIISDHSGQTIEKIAKDADRDFWMTAQEAKEYGMIDDIFTKEK